MRKSRTTRRKQSKVKGSGQECPLHRNKGQRRQPLRHCGNPPFGFAQGQALTSESTTLGWGSDIGKDCQLRYTPLPPPSECLDQRAVCKKCLQNLDVKELGGQNLDNKGLRSSDAAFAYTASALTMVCLFHVSRKVRRHMRPVNFGTPGWLRLAFCPIWNRLEPLTSRPPENRDKPETLFGRVVEQDGVVGALHLSEDS